MPSEISIVSFMQSLQRAPAAVVPSIGAPQLQQSILQDVNVVALRKRCSTYVATLPEAEALCARETGTSISIDIVDVEDERNFCTTRRPVI